METNDGERLLQICWMFSVASTSILRPGSPGSTQIFIALAMFAARNIGCAPAHPPKRHAPLFARERDPTYISSKHRPLYSSFFRGTASICVSNSSMPLRPWVSTDSDNHSSRHGCGRTTQRFASRLTEGVPTSRCVIPGNSLKVRAAFSEGEAGFEQFFGLLGAR